MSILTRPKRAPESNVVAINDPSGVPASVSAENPMPVTPGTPTAESVKSSFRIGTEFTRPSDTNQYTLGDVVANSTSAAVMQELANAALANGRGGIIANAILSKDGTTVTDAQFRVHLFSTNVAGGATIPGQDNAGFGNKYANSPYYIGYIDFATMAVGTGTNTGARAIATFVNLSYHCEATSLFYLVEARAAYTPASAEKFRFDIEVIRD